MSVVNKMLQDLEARKATPDAASADYLPPSKSSNRVWYVLLVLLVISLAAYLWFMRPHWTQDSLDSLKQLDPNIQQSQVNTQSKRPDTESQLSAGKKLSGEATTNEVDVALTSKIEETLAHEKNARESSVTSVDTPIEASEMLSATEPKTLNVVQIARAQGSAELSKNEAPSKSAKVAKNVVKNELKIAAQPETRFSISDSAEKDRAAGAKQSVISALSDGDNQLAIKRLEELLRVQPDNIEASKKLAALLFAQKRNNEAKYVLQQGIKNHPLRSDLRLMLARLYMQEKDNDAAIKLLNEVQADAVNQSEFLAYRAALLQQNGYYEQAKGDYLQLIAADAVNAKWWLGLAITQDRLGQSTEALVAYRTAYNKAQLSPSVVKFVEQRMILIEGAL
ncbi:MAG: MSHA biogenesis protein MshN [Paraglaciecola sp.]|jgi:MSHA biogenesis protein MshN